MGSIPTVLHCCHPFPCRVLSDLNKLTHTQVDEREAAETDNNRSRWNEATPAPDHKQLLERNSSLQEASATQEAPEKDGSEDVSSTPHEPTTKSAKDAIDASAKPHNTSEKATKDVTLSAVPEDTEKDGQT